MMRSQERHAVILTMVAGSEFVSIDEMAEACQTSTQTIRRDLNRLSELGKISRYHGGATRPESVAETAPSHAIRSASHVSEKAAAASLITDVIPDGASLFLAGGSTMEFVARALLTRSSLTVVTNSLHAAMTFYEKEGFRVHLVGGWLRTASGSLIGADTASYISQFSLDYAVIGTRGITMDGWLLEYDDDLVAPVEAMMANARSTVLVADSSKFGMPGIVRAAHLRDVDYFLTDGAVDGEVAANLGQFGVQLRIPTRSSQI